MKAAVLAKSSSYFIFSPGPLRYCDVYRRESGRCLTLPFFLTVFYPLPFQVFLLYQHQLDKKLFYLVFFFPARLPICHVISSSHSTSLPMLSKLPGLSFCLLNFTYVSLQRNNFDLMVNIIASIKDIVLFIIAVLL